MVSSKISLRPWVLTVCNSALRANPPFQIAVSVAGSEGMYAEL